MKNIKGSGGLNQLIQPIFEKLKSQSPVRRNMMASLFGVGVNLLNQIVLVPFYIICWGNELYSDWIVISALMTIFSISDAGLNNVIQNRFAIEFSKGQKNECNDLLNANFAIISITLLFMLALSGAYLCFFDISDHMGLHVLSRWDAGIIFLLLLLKVFIAMYSGVLNSIYRANHHADKAIFYDQITFLIVVLITFGFVITKESMIGMCIAICIPYLLNIGFKLSDSKKHFDHKISLLKFNRPLVKSLLLPSLSFLSFPIGNTIVLQGFTLVVNKFFGADEVVLFNTTRTLCNFMKTLVGTVQNSVWPEYSIAYGKADFSRMRKLHRKTIRVSLFFTIAMGTALLIVGSTIYEIWTRGKVEYSFMLMLGFVIALIIESIWISSSVTVMATNNHTKLGISFVLSAALALGLATLILTLKAQLNLITLPLIFMQIAMACIALREGLQLTHDKFSFSFLSQTKHS